MIAVVAGSITWRRDRRAETRGNSPFPATRLPPGGTAVGRTYLSVSYRAQPAATALAASVAAYEPALVPKVLTNIS
jgi:hypothetical protein